MHHILRTAFSLAREEGLEALTLARLADHLDYTPAALYRYFPSKDALLAELQSSVVAWLREATIRRVEAAAEHSQALDARDAALLPLVVTGLGFEFASRTAPAELGLLSMYLASPEFALSGPQAARVFETAWATLGDLAALFEAAARAGAIRPGDARERAVALWAGLQGVAQTRKLARSAAGQLDPTRIARVLIETLLMGWGADSQRVARLIAHVERHGLARIPGSVDDLLQASAA